MEASTELGANSGRKNKSLIDIERKGKKNRELEEGSRQVN